MTGVDVKSLLEKCNTFCTRALYDAAGLAVGRTHYEVAAEHFLLKCLENNDADLALLIGRYGVDRATVIRDFTRALDAFRSGNSARPGFSPPLIELLEAAWLIASVDLKQSGIRSGAVLLAYAGRPGYYAQSAQAPAFAELNRDEARRNFFMLTVDSCENAPDAAESAGDEAGEAAAAGGAAQGFIARYCDDFTAKARAGKIDEVFGRDAELRNILTILARRRKNNPILVGEPGVGKTAVIEGLAKRIAEGDVPENLRGVSLQALDMGLLEAGAGMKGEFERRLKGVIDEIKGSVKPIILFIDEAHMLVGAGGQAGGSDAANLLKPALARGELRTCAATTWKEYKKYFEKDAALARRFQLVDIAEPDLRTCGLILRGLCAGYESAHSVLIRDDAVTAAVEMSHRFITGRFLPDKAVDLIDTACAKVKMSLSVKPGVLEDTERAAQACEREAAALERDRADAAPVDEAKIRRLRAEMAELHARAAALTDRWNTERAAAEALIKARAACHAILKAAGAAAPVAAEAASLQGEAQAEPVAPATTDMPAAQAAPDASGAAPAAGPDDAVVQDAAALKAALDDATDALKAAQGSDPLVGVEVTPDVVAQVVSDWTGIPAGKVAREEAGLIADLDAQLEKRIKGQDESLEAISRVIKAGKAGLGDPEAPLGVFLLVGPSGVGKTETGLVLADLLFGNKEDVISINLSEFQERHTVSRLIGSPPGYVGYGEGGLLTEAVRRRPYSVILLDEAEKAHPDVLNLFYQAFDKGVITDGEGKKASFSETVIILTSNAASATILEAAGGETPVSWADLTKLIRPELAAHFKPALLARMNIVPYRGLDAAALESITRMKLEALGEKLLLRNKITLRCSDAVVATIVARCGDVDSGARNIEHILAANVLPQLAQSILEKMSGGGALPPVLELTVNENGGFSMLFTADGGEGAEAPQTSPATDSGQGADTPAGAGHGADAPAADAPAADADAAVTDGKADSRQAPAARSRRTRKTKR
ncbi:MAG: type VI secretion system ATPase TssH [Desulfovibrio sp.]|jgi:type VI secretion system protein VasG|nr:type VI secretion system ATPase TssH [Desulfovibrio sp.]